MVWRSAPPWVREPVMKSSLTDTPSLIPQLAVECRSAAASSRPPAPYDRQVGEREPAGAQGEARQRAARHQQVDADADQRRGGDRVAQREANAATVLQLT